jgi:hypothetical protein
VWWLVWNELITLVPIVGFTFVLRRALSLLLHDDLFLYKLFLPGIFVGMLAPYLAFWLPVAIAPASREASNFWSYSLIFIIPFSLIITTLVGGLLSFAVGKLVLSVRPN